jgi:hypothetical protein
MAGYLPDSNFYNVVHEMSHSGDPTNVVACTLSIRNDGFFDDNAVAEITNDVFYDIWSPFLDTQVTLDQTVSYRGPSPSAFGGLYVDGRTGARAGTSPPAQVAVLMQKRTAQIGKRSRGRMYLPWAASEAALDENGRLTPGGIAGLSTAGAAYIQALDNAQVPMYLCHSAQAFGSPIEVDSFQPASVCGTQRRRLPS